MRDQIYNPSPSETEILKFRASLSYKRPLQ